MAITDQSPDSVGVRDVAGGAHVAGISLGPNANSDFIQWAEAALLVTVVDYDVNGNVEYVGRGKAGAQTADGAWQIQRFYYNGNGDLIEIRLPELASTPGVPDAGLVHVYNDRAALTYPVLRN